MADHLSEKKDVQSVSRLGEEAVTPKRYGFVQLNGKGWLLQERWKYLQDTKKQEQKVVFKGFQDRSVITRPIGSPRATIRSILGIFLVECAGPPCMGGMIAGFF